MTAVVMTPRKKFDIDEYEDFEEEDEGSSFAVFLQDPNKFINVDLKVGNGQLEEAYRLGCQAALEDPHMRAKITSDKGSMYLEVKKNIFESLALSNYFLKTYHPQIEELAEHCLRAYGILLAKVSSIAQELLFKDKNTTNLKFVSEQEFLDYLSQVVSKQQFHEILYKPLAEQFWLGWEKQSNLAERWLRYCELLRKRHLREAKRKRKKL